MRYLMKQKVWTIGNDFLIKNEAGEDCYLVDGAVFTLRDQLSFQDLHKNELALIRQKILSWGPTYEIWRGGQLAAVVKEHLFTLLRYVFTVDVNADGPGPEDLEVNGDLIAREYLFTCQGRVVAEVSRRWFSWTDTYGVDVREGEDDLLILACTVVIDMCTQKHRSNN